jgi:GxxExxY protein
MTELLYEELSYKIRGCCFTVYNTLGFGHKEDIYQKALEFEFIKQKVSYESQKSLDIYYDNKKVGNYRPDLIIDDKIIVEIKAVEYIPQKYEQQLIYYLKGINFKLGLLVNFGSTTLYIKRLIWSPNYQRKLANNL